MEQNKNNVPSNSNSDLEPVASHSSTSANANEQIVSLVIENTWLSREYSEFGWGNGYVVIPQGHPWYGKDYDSDVYADVDINGGLTFSEFIGDHPKLHEKFKPFIGQFVIGFDTAHSWDSLSLWPDERSVQDEADRLKDQAIKAFELLNSKSALK